MVDWDRPLMGIKEGTYCTEPWVLAVNKESWNTPSKTNDVVYGDSHNIIKKLKKKKLLEGHLYGKAFYTETVLPKEE